MSRTARKESGIVKKPTIHDVARLSSVSIATVSRVLNNSGRVEARTASKVRRAIDQLSYVPDNIARGMRHKKSYAIGYIVSDIANVHFTVAAKYLQEYLAGEGYSLMICSTGGDKERELQHLRLMQSQQVDALLINVTGKNDAYIVELSQKLPIVLLSRKIHDKAFKGDFVGSDAFQGAYALGRHILSLGHRRIGLIRGPMDISTGSERLNGFMAALNEEGVELGESMVYPGNYYRDSGWLGAEKLLSAPQPPTILVAMNNTMAFGVLEYLKKNNYRVPEDISCAAFGNIANRELLYVSPAAVSEKPDQEGRLAGELLLRRIADMNATPMTAVVPSDLLAGNSILKLENVKSQLRFTQAV